MPLPTVEEMRSAVEKEVYSGIYGRGDWFATLPDGTEVSFRPAREFSVTRTAYEGTEDNLEEVEKTYKFRIVVEAIQE